MLLLLITTTMMKLSQSLASLPAPRALLQHHSQQQQVASGLRDVGCRMGDVGCRVRILRVHKGERWRDSLLLSEPVRMKIMNRV